MKQSLIQKFEDKTAVISTLSLGYFRLPLMLRYVEIGFKVLGFDIDQDKIGQLSSGSSYIEHIPSSIIANAHDQGFEATADSSWSTKPNLLIFAS